MTVLDSTNFLSTAPQAPDQLEGELFSAWRIRILSPDEFAALGPRGELTLPQLAYLAHFGLLAPTTHNTVPERFSVRGGRLVVAIDRRVVLPASDRAGRQAAVSLGAVLENVTEAARAVGLEPAVELMRLDAAALAPFTGHGPAVVAVAEIGFTWGAEPLPRGHLEAMIARKVVRAEFDGVELPAPLAAELRALVARHDGLELHLLTDAPSLLFLGKFQELADTTVFNRDDFALELGDWLVPNDATTPVAMRGREFGLSDEASARIHGGLRRVLPLLPDEIAGVAKAGNLGMRSSAAVLVVTVAEDSLALRIAAGRAYEAVALRLQREGFATAMHAGLTEVEAPNLALRGRLRTRQRPTVVFRAGRPLRPDDALRPHAARPRLASLTFDA